MTEVYAPMNGKVIKIVATVGQKVQEDEDLIIMEAMKMEMPVGSPAAGTVKEIKVQAGDTVAADQVLALIE
jgi:acetyl-CoA carboxylase biotin carboxyl carrier protein